MNRRHIPQDVLDSAHARSAARAARDWPEADRLRAEIEAAGWTVVDRGTDFALSPSAPPDVVDGGLARYGSSAAVPSRLEDEPTAPATVVLVATDAPDDLARALGGVRATSPAGTTVVIVADGPSEMQALALHELAPDDRTEVVWTSARLGPAAARNIGLRRSRGAVVVHLDPGVEPTGDFVTPLVAALDDPGVAIAGGWGLVTSDLRAFEAGAGGDVTVVDGLCQAVRRGDAAERSPIDERLRSARGVDTWWSLVLRDAGDGALPRRAIRLAELPVARHDPPGGPPATDTEAARLARRDTYRILAAFGGRRDLLTPP